MINFESFVGPLGEWFQKFTLSPGLAGIFAVCAAWIAFTGVRAQTKSNEEQKRKDQWWSTYTWVFDTVTDPKTHENGLKKTAAVNVLMHLMDSGHSSKQVDLLDSMKDLLESTSVISDAPNETAPAAEPQPSPEQSPPAAKPPRNPTRKASVAQDFERRFELALNEYESKRESLEFPIQHHSAFEYKVFRTLKMWTAPAGIQLKPEVRIGGMIVDLVAIKDDKVVVIDVNTRIQRGRFSRWKQLADEQLLVIDGKECKNLGVLVVTDDVTPKAVLDQYNEHKFEIIPWKNGHGVELIFKLLEGRLK